MTEKTPRRLRVRKRQSSVDQAVIDKLVEEQLSRRAEEILAKEKKAIAETAWHKGNEQGYGKGQKDGFKQGQARGKEDATQEFHSRAAGQVDDRLRRFGTNESLETAGSERYEGLNQGWGFLVPYTIQNRCSSPADVSVFAYKAELQYDYRVDVNQRVFTLYIWKGLQDGSTRKVAVDCNFSEESLQQASGANALLDILCTICVEGAKYMDGSQLCEYMADWVTTTQARNAEGPTIRVPKSARPTALKKFRHAVGLMNE